MKNVKMMVRPIAAFAVCGSVLMLPAMAPGFDREKAKEIVKEKGPAVVTLEIVMEMRAAGYGEESEQRVTATATIVNEEGLAVTALSTVDPGYVYAKMSGEEDAFVTRLKSMKYILHDNSEVNAVVVLRDPDQDIVFLRPVEGEEEKTYTYIDLEDNKAAEVLDAAFTIGRLGRIGRRATLGMSGEIQAAIRGPRTYYIPSSELVSSRTGTPVFAEDGKLIGITAIYIFPGGQAALGEEDEPYTYAVIPAGDIAAITDQAEDAPPEPTPEADENGDEDTGEPENEEEEEMAVEPDTI